MGCHPPLTTPATNPTIAPFLQALTLQGITAEAAAADSLPGVAIDAAALLRDLVRHQWLFSSTEPIPASAGSLRMGIAGVTSTGKQRTRNEDMFLVQHLTWWEDGRRRTGKW